MNGALAAAAGQLGERYGDPLDFIFHARSIALIGLSSDPRKMTGAPLGILRQTGFAGPIYPVNPRVAEIGGLRSYPSIASLPQAPDVAMIMLGAKHCAQAVRECAAKGTRAVVVLSSGFEETDGGQQAAAELLAAARESGVAVVGPNCEGVWSVAPRVVLTFGSAAKRDVLTHAPVAILSQSGAMAGAIARHLQNDAIGCAYMVSVGNETVLTLADYMEWMIRQPDVRVLLLFIEGLRDGERLVRLIGQATARGIRVAALKSGNSKAGVEVAASHTGKIASDYQVYRDLLAGAGAILVDSLTDLIAAGEVLSVAPDPAARLPELSQPSERGVAVFSIPGGTRALTVDQCEAHGVPLSTFARSTVAQLSAALPEFGGVENPTDLTGQVLSHQGLFDQTLSIIAADPNTEALIVQVANRGPSDVIERTELLGQMARDTGVPVIATFLGDSLPAADRARLRAHKVLCARDPAEAALFLGWLYRARAAAAQPLAPAPTPLADAPAPADWASTMAWLQACGIAVPPWRELAAGDDVAQVCAGMARVAVKALPEDAAHKTEAGLLALDVQGAKAIAQEAARIRQALGKPQARILVQAMVEGGVEVVLAARHNPDFGPVMAIGLGGIAVELFQDITWLALPTSEAAVRKALARLKLAQVLAGFRGKPPADAQALVRAAVAFGQRFVATRPSLAEFEINPLLVLARGVVAVDALLANTAQAQP
ncbi:MAG: acetate--CoA ligase family protein [Betaproteobacteria bacterium]